MTSNKWAFMAGSIDINVPPVYPPTRGSHGSSSSYWPGSRRYSCFLWVDSTNNVYLSGDTTSYASDMWRWQPSTQLWSWVCHIHRINCSH